MMSAVPELRPKQPAAGIQIIVVPLDQASLIPPDAKLSGSGRLNPLPAQTNLPPSNRRRVAAAPPGSLQTATPRVSLTELLLRNAGFKVLDFRNRAALPGTPRKIEEVSG